jgi:hypothetical protein
MFRVAIATVMLGGVALMSSISVSAPAYQDLIIQVRPGVSENSVRELSKKVGGEFQYGLGGPAYLVRVVPPHDTDAVMKTLQSEKDVISVERDQKVRIPE